MDIEVVKEIAICEIKSPNWLLTKQYLYVNDIVYCDGNPEISDITFTNEGVAVVWFPIVGQSYYFVVHVEFFPTPDIRLVSMSAGNKVNLVVVAENTDLHELTTALKGITYSCTWRKGEVRRKTKRGDVLWKDSGFEIEPYPKTSGEVEDKIKTILELLKDRKQQVKELSKIADHVELSIGYFGYKDEMWGIHLDPDIVRELAELGVSIDIDLYASGSDLLDAPD